MCKKKSNNGSTCICTSYYKWKNNKLNSSLTRKMLTQRNSSNVATCNKQRASKGLKMAISAVQIHEVDYPCCLLPDEGGSWRQLWFIAGVAWRATANQGISLILELLLLRKNTQLVALGIIVHTRVMRTLEERKYKVRKEVIMMRCMRITH